MKQFEESAYGIHKILKAMTFRQILMLALLVMVLVPPYLAIVLISGIGPDFLTDVVQPVRFKGFVGDCPELVMSLNGKHIQVLYHTYRPPGPNSSGSYVLAAHSDAPDWSISDKQATCKIINRDVSRITN